MLRSPDVETLLGIEEDALWNCLEMAAKLSQDVATSFVDYSQMDKATGMISGGQVEGEERGKGRGKRGRGERERGRGERGEGGGEGEGRGTVHKVTP